MVKMAENTALWAVAKRGVGVVMFFGEGCIEGGLGEELGVAKKRLTSVSFVSMRDGTKL